MGFTPNWSSSRVWERIKIRMCVQSIYPQTIYVCLYTLLSHELAPKVLSVQRALTKKATVLSFFSCLSDSAIILPN